MLKIVQAWGFLRQELLGLFSAFSRLESVYTARVSRVRILSQGTPRYNRSGTDADTPPMLIEHIRKFRAKTTHQKIQFIASLWTRFKSVTYYRVIFGSFGTSLLYRPTHIMNPHSIRVGDGVHIRPGVRMEVLPHNPRLN